MRVLLAVLFSAALTSCAPVQVEQTPNTGLGKLPLPAALLFDSVLEPETALRNFINVVETVEPVAEQVCGERSPGQNCDFQIVVDRRVNAPPNAFQTVDEAGRPIIAFTTSLVAGARNRDELAFIMAHEAAHHIRGHLSQTRQNATLGAVIASTLFGGDTRAAEAAGQLGAAIGARTYSKNFELEADALGTVIAKWAGFDPVRGAQFFARIPDPGNRFLGSHPANADRLATVQRVAAGL